MQGSSIGTYSTQWMNEFHYSARGESPEDWLDIKKAHREKQPYPPIKIIFPSLKTVKATVLGEPVRLKYLHILHVGELMDWLCCIVEFRAGELCSAVRINGKQQDSLEITFMTRTAKLEGF